MCQSSVAPSEGAFTRPFWIKAAQREREGQTGWLLSDASNGYRVRKLQDTIHRVPAIFEAGFTKFTSKSVDVPLS